MSGNRLVRVTCTLPSGLVQAADTIAAREGRSRSWVVAEALRRFVAEHGSSGGGARVVKEGGAPPAHVREAFDAAWHAQLAEEAALTPDARVRIADELAAEAERIRPQPGIRQLIAFDTWEDFLAWKRTDLLR